jgi:hypothetical protein
MMKVAFAEPASEHGVAAQLSTGSQWIGTVDGVPYRLVVALRDDDRLGVPGDDGVTVRKNGHKYLGVIST